MEAKTKPHAVCVPFPVQGHIKPMMKIAKILHQKGFHITLVNTEFNHKRLLSSRGPNSLSGLPCFRFESIPDGLPPTSSSSDATQDIPSLCKSTATNCIGPFKDLLAKLNSYVDDDVPRVSCIVSDGAMTFTLEVAEELGISNVVFWPASACAYLAYLHFPKLLDMGLTPLKDVSYLTNGYLEQTLDWIPGMKDLRLRDVPSFIRTTNPDDEVMRFIIQQTQRHKKACSIILNTFVELERDAITDLSSILLPAPIYSIGPLNLLQQEEPHVDDEHPREDEMLGQLGSNLWKEDPKCIEWLDHKDPNSVVYVNFGSITVLTFDQLMEFAWGLANSKHAFLWIVRPDLIVSTGGETIGLPPTFLEEIKDRGLLACWCPQEQVLRHPSVGGFLTHCGWNSTIESVSYGVPMICWPFFGDQQTNCWYCCTHLGVGMELDNNVQRDAVESVVKELMSGEKGKDLKKQSLLWKSKAAEAVKTTSACDLDKLVNHIIDNSCSK